MLTNFKPIMIAIAVVVVAVTAYKGVSAAVEYVEDKAVAEDALRQQEEHRTATFEALELTVDFNAQLTQEIQVTQDYFRDTTTQLDALLQKRVTQAAGKKTTPAKPTLQVASVEDAPAEDVTELTLAWKSFCRLRPSYKECVEGSHP